MLQINELLTCNVLKTSGFLVMAVMFIAVIIKPSFSNTVDVYKPGLKGSPIGTG